MNIIKPCNCNHNSIYNVHRITLCEKDMEIIKLLQLVREATTDVPINNGKGIDEVQERQR